MLKRGLLFLLVFIIFLQSSLAQAVPDSCLAVPQNPSEEQLNQLITEATARIWNIYSQIPKYSGNNKEILKAALEGLNSWKPEPPYTILSNYKKRIADEMGRQAGGSGSCIDDYSLNAKDDCWNNDALCVENRCVKFEDMGWSEEILFYVRSLRDPDIKVRMDAASTLGEIGSEKSVPALIKTLESDNSIYVKSEAAYALGKIKYISPRAAELLGLSGELESENAVAALIKALESNPDFNLKKAISYALGQIDSDQAFTALINALELDSDYNGKIHAIFGLSRVGPEHSDQAVAALIKTLGINSVYVRTATISALGTIGSEVAVPYLEYVSKNDRDSAVRDDALIALEKIHSKTSSLKEKDLFKMIYSNNKLSGFPQFEKNSISISVSRFLLNNKNIPTENEIDSAINLILNKRKIFKDKIILGKDKYFILFSHEDPMVEKQIEPTKEFARARGITKFSADFKGPESKQDIINSIIDSKNQGETVIWVDTHGLTDYVCLGGGIPNQERNIGESCLGFKYDEFADILLQRGNLDNVILIIDSCYSYNFAKSLLDSLTKKHSSSFPTVISSANKDSLAFNNLFLYSLKQLKILSGNPLLGRHIYEAEQFSYRGQDYTIQDFAIFFSEDGISLPLEIAMDSLNPSECGCIGDSCPIEPVQGISS